MAEITNSAQGFYSERLERLIAIALQDGTLTDKERAVLVASAQKEGVDPDEFEMILDVRLQEAQANIVHVQDKVINVQGTNNTIQTLETKIAAINAEWTEYKMQKQAHMARQGFFERLGNEFLGSSTDYEDDFQNRINQQILQTLIPFNVSKEELVDITMYMKAHVRNFEVAVLRGSRSPYYIKYREAMDKIKSLYPNEPMFSNLLAEEEHIWADERVKVKTLESKIATLEERIEKKWSLFSGINNKEDDELRLEELKEELEEHKALLSRANR